MPDMEKVIKGLEEISDYFFDIYRNDTDSYKCEKAQEYSDVAIDALAMLKERDAVLAHWDDDTGHWIEGDRNGIDPHTRTTGEMIDTFRCSWCGFYQYWKTPFCPNCGAKMEVKWNEP